MVFFSGTLQEGIQTALQQSKLVVCFVTDGQEESQTWETEYLTDDSVAPSLEKDAVVLRLEAGSQEAGYLAAIFPLPKNPTLVIIKNGELKEYVAAGTAKEELLARISKAFTAQTGSAQGQAGESTASAVSRTDTQASAPSANPTPSSATHAEQAQAQAQAQASASASALLTEAERRRETARKEREEMERERRRREKAKQPAGSNEDPSKAKQSDAVKKASQQLAERQKQAREERARVLKLIEDDKAERRARQERERQERDGGSSTPRPDASSGGPTTAAAAGPSSSVTRRHDECALQVRLFDGSTIRTRFPVSATLARDVRPWIDEKTRAGGSGSGPYTFKVILTPQPNRAIDHAAGEEEQALGELGLAPSATLVLTPVDRYASSSSGHTSLNAGLTSPVSRLVTAVLAFVANILGGIAGALGGLGSGAGGGGADGGGGNGARDAGREREDSGADAASRQDGGSPSASGAAQATGRDGGGGSGSSSSRRIKGFQNPDDSKKDYQLYNGNSLNFEPRKDDDDKDK